MQLRVIRQSIIEVQTLESLGVLIEVGTLAIIEKEANGKSNMSSAVTPLLTFVHHLCHRWSARITADPLLADHASLLLRLLAIQVRFAFKDPAPAHQSSVLIAKRLLSIYADHGACTEVELQDLLGDSRLLPEPDCTPGAPGFWYAQSTVETFIRSAGHFLGGEPVAERDSLALDFRPDYADFVECADPRGRRIPPGPSQTAHSLSDPLRPIARDLLTSLPIGHSPTEALVRVVALLSILYGLEWKKYRHIYLGEPNKEFIAAIILQKNTFRRVVGPLEGEASTTFGQSTFDLPLDPVLRAWVCRAVPREVNGPVSLADIGGRNFPDRFREFLSTCKLRAFGIDLPRTDALHKSFEWAAGISAKIPLPIVSIFRGTLLGGCRGECAYVSAGGLQLTDRYSTIRRAIYELCSVVPPELPAIAPTNITVGAPHLDLADLVAEWRRRVNVAQSHNELTSCVMAWMQLHGFRHRKLHLSPAYCYRTCGAGPALYLQDKHRDGNTVGARYLPLDTAGQALIAEIFRIYGDGPVLSYQFEGKSVSSLEKPEGYDYADFRVPGVSAPGRTAIYCSLLESACGELPRNSSMGHDAEADLWSFDSYLPGLAYLGLGQTALQQAHSQAGMPEATATLVARLQELPPISPPSVCPEDLDLFLPPTVPVGSEQTWRLLPLSREEDFFGELICICRSRRMPTTSSAALYELLLAGHGSLTGILARLPYMAWSDVAIDRADPRGQRVYLRQWVRTEDIGGLTPHLSDLGGMTESAAARALISAFSHIRGWARGMGPERRLSLLICPSAQQLKEDLARFVRGSVRCAVHHPGGQNEDFYFHLLDRVSTWLTRLREPGYIAGALCSIPGFGQNHIRMEDVRRDALSHQPDLRHLDDSKFEARLVCDEPFVQSAVRTSSKARKKWERGRLDSTEVTEMAAAKLNRALNKRIHIPVTEAEFFSKIRALGIGPSESRILTLVGGHGSRHPYDYQIRSLSGRIFKRFEKEGLLRCSPALPMLDAKRVMDAIRTCDPAELPLRGDPDGRELTAWNLWLAAVLTAFIGTRRNEAVACIAEGQLLHPHCSYALILGTKSDAARRPVSFDILARGGEASQILTDLLRNDFSRTRVIKPETWKVKFDMSQSCDSPRLVPVKWGRTNPEQLDRVFGWAFKCHGHDLRHFVAAASALHIAEEHLISGNFQLALESLSKAIGHAQASTTAVYYLGTYLAVLAARIYEIAGVSPDPRHGATPDLPGPKCWRILQEQYSGAVDQAVHLRRTLATVRSIPYKTGGYRPRTVPVRLIFKPDFDAGLHTLRSVFEHLEACGVKADLEVVGVSDAPRKKIIEEIMEGGPVKFTRR